MSRMKPHSRRRRLDVRANGFRDGQQDHRVVDRVQAMPRAGNDDVITRRAVPVRLRVGQADPAL